MMSVEVIDVIPCTQALEPTYWRFRAVASVRTVLGYTNTPWHLCLSVSV